jgi:DNA helicase-2/ATP-dependent DNA helicase PcrA
LCTGLAYFHLAPYFGVAYPYFYFMAQEPKLNAHFLNELERLNPEQRYAVEQIEGPMMVIAGPGTGKTQMLSARVGSIILNGAAQAHNILCLTYTDAGAVAMRKRLMSFIGPDAYRVSIQTFHGFCNQVIREHSNHFPKREMELLDDLEKKKLLKAMIKDLPFGHILKKHRGEFFFEARRLGSLFDLMGREQLSPAFIQEKTDEYLRLIENDTEPFQFPEYRLGRASKSGKKGDLNAKYLELKERLELLTAALPLHQVYQERKLADNRYDYNDMINWVLEAFDQNTYLLNLYQERYTYLLVDEFQDTNGAQLKLVRQLVSYWEDDPNLFVVGDDDQAIYSFQGANFLNLKSLLDEYPSTMKALVLKENYRSAQTILDAARALIDRNKLRLNAQLPQLEKVLDAKGVNAAISVRPALLGFDNEMDQYAYVLNELRQKKAEGKSLSEIAIIYAKNAEGEQWIQLLDSFDIPYNAKRRQNIIKEPIAENLIKIMHFLFLESKAPNSATWLLFEIMHFAPFRIPPDDIAQLSWHLRYTQQEGSKENWRHYISSLDRLKAFELKEPERLIAFHGMITSWLGQLHNTTIQVLFERILSESHLLSDIMQDARKTFYLQVLNTLFDFIKERSNQKRGYHLSQFLDDLEEMDEENVALEIEVLFNNQEGVHLVTAHSSKGLEYDEVFIQNAIAEEWEKKKGTNTNFVLPPNLLERGITTDGFFTESPDKEGEEEARRLFYVAMTRARKRLEILVPEKNLKAKEKSASLFVAEIQEHAQIEIEKRIVPVEVKAEMLEAMMKGAGKPNIELLEKTMLDRALEKYSMSPTHLNKYLACPISFYFENLLRVPTARNASSGFGTAIHDTLRDIFEHRMQRTDLTFPPVSEAIGWFEKHLETRHSHFVEYEFTMRKESGKIMVENWFDKILPTWEPNGKAEIKLERIEYQGVPINGQIDRFAYTADGSIYVYDYKTGDPESQYTKPKLQRPTAKKPIGGDYWRQVVFYKILMENDRSQSYKVSGGAIQFVEAKDLKKPSFPRFDFHSISQEEVDLVGEQIKTAYHGIMNRSFSQGCGEEHCTWCNFVKANYRDITFTSAEAEEEELFTGMPE